jgi:hypothetical protein
MATGKTNNQHIFINISYRNRGNDLRIIRKSSIKKTNVNTLLLKIRALVRRENTNIIPYSPKKIKMKFRLEYSILNPLISSLSPSAKSNGARLHSAIHVVHHKKINKTLGVNTGLVCLMLALDHNRSVLRRINANLISYLMVCAEARILPNIANLDLERIPVIRRI